MIKRYILVPLLTILFFVFDLTFGYSLRSLHNEPVQLRGKSSFTTLSNSNSDIDEYAQLDATIERFIRKWDVAGASVAVAKDGQLVYAKGFGFSNREQDEKMQPHHLLRIASVSKLVTAVAIMKLIESGRLDLNQSVFGDNGILNENIYKGFIDERVEQITVKHLLNHSAGWTTRWGDHLFMHQSISRQLSKELPLCKDDIISFALAKRLHFMPGTRSAYNNLGYIILERVIEKVSGRTYENYVTDNVFKPLDIYDAFIAHNYDSLRYPWEVRYYEVPEAEPVPAFDGKQQMVNKSRGGNDIRTLGAAGGWVISSVSLVKFLLAIDTDTKNGILSKKSAKVLNQSDPGYHPLGWRWVSKDGTKWRTGSFAGSSALAISRSDGLTYVFISNSSPWVGARFPYEVNRMMAGALQRVNDWPEINLFTSPLLRNYSSAQSMKFHKSDQLWNGNWEFIKLMRRV